MRPRSPLVDAHAHLEAEPDYPESLLRTCDRLGIERVCLSGLGPAFDMAGNEQVRQAVQAHPDRFIGFRYLRLGQHRPQDVDLAVEEGFRGLKFTIPLRSYDDEAYFPVYERAQAYSLPCLFHCGIVTTRHYLGGVSSARMRPVHLDTIAHEFPQLSLICAHLGMPWYEEAAAVARILPNVYVDLSGSPRGWRVQKDIEFFRSLFYWPEAWRKVLWGSDVHYTDLEAALRRDRALVEAVDLPQDQRDAYFGGTLLSLLPAC
ncbi:MAG: amidohydrolase family protein [Anaerolineae bacterium]|nr:amidohydrolase family protein [Anaerolineae bacterium]